MLWKTFLCNDNKIAECNINDTRNSSNACTILRIDHRVQELIDCPIKYRWRYGHWHLLVVQCVSSLWSLVWFRYHEMCCYLYLTVFFFVLNNLTLIFTDNSIITPSCVLNEATSVTVDGGLYKHVFMVFVSTLAVLWPLQSWISNCYRGWVYPPPPHHYHQVNLMQCECITLIRLPLHTYLEWFCPRTVFENTGLSFFLWNSLYRIYIHN